MNKTFTKLTSLGSRLIRMEMALARKLPKKIYRFGLNPEEEFQNYDYTLAKLVTEKK